MGKAFAEVKEIQERLIAELSLPPYEPYFNWCGISKLSVMDEREVFTLGEGESLEDYCLSVTLREQPKEDLDFSREREGVRVFYQVTGQVTPL